MLTKKDLEKLADLARMKIGEAEEEKLLRDLEGILGHFEELKALDTDNVEPMNGGTMSVNAWRSDEIVGRLDGQKAREEFPDADNDYLKVPPVFNADED